MGNIDQHEKRILHKRMKNFVLLGAAGYIAPRHMKAIQETGNRLHAYKNQIQPDPPGKGPGQPPVGRRAVVVVIVMMSMRCMCHTVFFP